MLAYIDTDSGPSVGAIVGVALVIFVIYFAICWWIARYAESKGQSFIGFLLLGVVVSPIISLIVALVIDDRAPLPAGSDRLDRLQKLTELREAGSLSPEEFETEKARILAEQA